MNKEEEEAKEYLQGMLFMYNNRPAPISQKALKILSNLIEKQQEEIEDLKEENKKIFNQYEKRVNELEREIAVNSISKDKIWKIFYSNNEDLEIILKIKKLLEE